MKKLFRIFAIISGLWVFLTQSVLAAPYFSLSGDGSIAYLNTNTYELKINTDGATITAAQTLITFDGVRLSHIAVNLTQDAVPCLPAPANPTLGMGSKAAPYFYNDNTLVVSCGFPGGYKTLNSTGELLLNFKLKSIIAENAVSSINFTNDTYWYIESPIAAGISAPMALTIYAASVSATPTPQPTPTLVQDVLTLDQMTFTEISTTRRSVTPRTVTTVNSLTSSQSATAVALDNRIPSPPPMTPRPTAPPIQLPTAAVVNNEPSGDVLSIQSLRELFLPGASNANQTVVMFNLISLLTLVIILIILVWRLITISHINKLKHRYMKELISGELSVLQSKITDSTSKREEMMGALESLKDRVEKS